MNIIPDEKLNIQLTRHRTKHMDWYQMMVGKVFEEYIEVEVYIEVYIEVEVRVQAQAQEQVRIELDQEHELELDKVAALAQDMVEEQVQGHTTERN